MAWRPRLTWRTGLVSLALVAVGVWAILRFTPSGDYLFVPGKAQPVAPLVAVPNEPPASDGRNGGIYMVDIFVRRASILENWFPSIAEGSTRVPREVLNPAGLSERRRDEISSLDMTRSQEIAAAVALRALGYPVEAVPLGAQVTLVTPGSPADAELRIGDVVVAANGRDVRTPEDLRAAMEGLRPGDAAEFTVRREESTVDLRLSTQPSPEDPERAIVGVVVEQAADLDLPVDIRIDAGDVGGPSAGLAFALDIVDELGRDLDGGRTIVATGQLGLDGEVVPIGGVKQKVIGAKNAGADLFIVPQRNREEAERYAGDDLEIVAVGTFDEALEAVGAAPLTD